MLCPVCGNTDFYLKEEHLEQVFKNETIEIKAEVMVCKTKDCFYKEIKMNEHFRKGFIKTAAKKDTDTLADRIDDAGMAGLTLGAIGGGILGLAGGLSDSSVDKAIRGALVGTGLGGGLGSLLGLGIGVAKEEARNAFKSKKKN